MAQGDRIREKTLETMGALALVALLAGLAMGSTALLWGSAALLAIALFLKPLARWLARGWIALGRILATISTAALLAIIFLLFLWPIAVVTRLVRRDFLQLRRRSGSGGSYWHQRDHVFVAGDLDKPW